MPGIKLSLCIATFNRGAFIAETLESICRDKPDDVEVVIVDGASPDQTADAVAPYAARYPNVRYYREETNSGVDADYDKAVGYATGEYCWLAPDDDLVIPGAIRRLLLVLQQPWELVVVNSEVWNTDLSRSLQTSMVSLAADRSYSAADRDLLFADVATSLSFIGSVVIRRSVWLARDRGSYNRSLYGHVGVIFQEPPLDRVAVIAEPMLKIRYGNSMWSPRSFEVLYFKWPAMVWSFTNVADSVKERVVLREPWRRLRSLLKSRAIGEYSQIEFRRFLADRRWDAGVVAAYAVSLFPARLANAVWVTYYLLFQRSASFTLFDLLRSPHASVVSHGLARLLGARRA